MTEKNNTVPETAQRSVSRKTMVWATAIIVPVLLAFVVAMVISGGGTQANAEQSEMQILTEKSLLNAETLKLKKEEQKAVETKLEQVKSEVKTLQAEKEAIRNSIDSYINKNIADKATTKPVVSQVFTNLPSQK